MSDTLNARERRLEAARDAREGRRWVRAHVDLLHAAMDANRRRRDLNTHMAVDLAVAALEEAQLVASVTDDGMCRPNCEHELIVSVHAECLGPDQV